MNLIRIYAGLVLLIALSSFSFSFFNNRKYKKEHKVESFIGEVAPWEEWNEILIGKWEFKVKTSGPAQLSIYEGQVEYRSDNTCTWGLNCRMYESYIGGKTVKESSDDLKIFGGIVRNCKWAIDIEDKKELWWEEFNCSCNDNLSYRSPGYSTIDLCSEISNWGVTYITNSYVGINEAAVFKPIQFNKNKIVFQEHDFASNADNYYIFTRLEE